MSLPPGPNLAPVEQREVGPDPLPPRPATIRTATAVMVLGGVLAAADAVVRLVAWDRDEIQRNLDSAGISPGNLEGFFTIVRIVGFAGGVAVSAGWLVHARASHQGRRWVRPWAGALATIFVLMNLSALGEASPLGHAYLGLRVAVAVTAVALLWLPPSTAFLRAVARPH